MKLPRLLDRERRIHHLSVLLREKTLAATMWFRMYQKLSVALAVARAERDNARDRVAEPEAKYEGIPS